MAISRGISKVVAYKKETTWGVLAGAAGGKQLRRVSADVNLVKEAYESEEQRSDYQVADMRHGIRTAEGTVSGELSPRTYSDFIGSILSRDFTVLPDLTALDLTIGALVGMLYPVTRAAGDFVADGIKVGQVLRFTGFPTAANNDRNVLVAAVSALSIQVLILDDNAISLPFVPENAPTANVVTPGSYTFAPLTGHTNDSYTLEQFFADNSQSEVYTGLRFGSMNVSMPASGLVTCDFDVLGKDLTLKGTTQYFTAPAASGTDGIFASVNGAMLVNGLPVALITSADFTVDRNLETAPVIGSNSVAEIFQNRIRVSGNLSVYFQDAVFRDYFDAETEVSLVFALTTNSTGTADFMSFAFPRVKVGSFTKSDTEGGLIAETSFTALLNAVGTAGLPLTTMAVQDSTLI